MFNYCFLKYKYSGLHKGVNKARIKWLNVGIASIISYVYSVALISRRNKEITVINAPRYDDHSLTALYIIIPFY